jgi:5'-nucleotidase
VTEKPLLLLTNDDGVDAPGLRALAAALSGEGEVMIVAPDRERSASSHCLSLNQPLRVDERQQGVWAVDGTPVDCVYLALLHFCKRSPAVCVSGVNNGYNLGADVFYSGTVAAALEATLRGVPSLAVSLERRGPQDFSHAAAFARTVVRSMLSGKLTVGTGAMLSINLPAGPVRGCEVTRLGKRVYRDQVAVREDLRGMPYYWIGGPEEAIADAPGSDQAAVQGGSVSVTPLGLDLTHAPLFDALQAWQLSPEGGFRATERTSR